MLIYLDANIVQYCADQSDFIFEDTERVGTNDPSLQKELIALRRLVEFEQLGNWDFAAPRHLLAELCAGKPTHFQRDTYKVFEEAWSQSVWTNDESPTEGRIREIEQTLIALRLRHAADRRHLAEALALGTSWFLTNDGEVIRKTKGLVGYMHV